jgi:hypothetical protein
MNDRPPARVVFGSPNPDTKPPSDEPKVEFDPTDNSAKLTGGIIFSTLGGTLPAALWLMVYMVNLSANSMDASNVLWLFIIFPMQLGVAGGIILAMWVAFIPWLLARNPTGWILGLVWFVFAMFTIKNFIVKKELFIVGAPSPRQLEDTINAVMGGLTGWFVFLAIAAQIYIYRRRKKANSSDHDLT